ncbi:MAG TPA: adenosylcobinamide-GDP ribazoletransferase [Methylophilaceae bacterium]|nr:adenosylcobinamide-GDP ribazoletransferase [Methylophilaceae bacterium]
MKALLRSEWRYFKMAVIFFTRIPLHVDDFSEHDLDRSARYFPLVGLLVGAVAAASFGITMLFWPLELAVLASMVATILLTGAFHEDGLADAVDGLGGSFDKARALAIMQDSRIGSYGAIALVLGLLMKFEALIHIPPPLLPGVLVVGHALSRFCALLVIYLQPYVRSEGKSKPLATTLSRKALAFGAIPGLLPLMLLTPRLLLALLPVVIVWLWFSRKLKQRLGGYTGDCLGAMQQLTEVAFYLGVVIWSTY